MFILCLFIDYFVYPIIKIGWISFMLDLRVPETYSLYGPHTPPVVIVNLVFFIDF